MTQAIPLPTVLLALLIPCGAAAQTAQTVADEDRPIVRTLKATEAITVDGHLDDAAWSRAPISDAFTQVDPEEGMPVSERTEARILFDDEALYIGVRLEDRQPVSGRLGRRDMDLLDSDWLGVVIDSYHDHRTAFSFDVNPVGVQRDAVKSMSAGGNEVDDLSWDPVWQAAVSVDEGGWTAEYRIPFSQLRFSGSEEPVWGIQLERVIGRRREYSVLSFTPKAESGGIPTYGHLVGLHDVQPGQRLEISPYVLTRAEYVDPGANPFRTDSEYFGSGGVDVLYRVTSDFALNATLNPDFGQVEVDPAVINLSVYETFFQEKRPFFVEGSEIFDFGRNTSGGQLFYSRRIGRRPQIAAPSSAADVPDATTILGAGKLTGKTEGGWSLGIMEAVTAQENARYLSSDNVPGDWVVEPRTNYFVGRARRDARAGQSALGMMFTAMNRNLNEVAQAGALREAAYAGGLDFRHEFGNRTWVLQATAVGSRITGDPAAIVATQRFGNHFFQRPDADHLDIDGTATSMDGYSLGASIGRQSGQHWRGSLQLATTSPGYEVNDLGFQTRTDRRDAALNMTYLENQPGTFWRNYSVNTAVRHEQNHAGQKVQNFAFLGTNFTHLSFWNVNLGLVYWTSAVDDRSTRGGPLMERPGRWQLNGGFRSDQRQSVTFGLSGSGGKDTYGGSNAGARAELGIKTSPRWSLSFSPSLNKAHNLAQYVGTVSDSLAIATYGAHYLFAPLRQTTVAMETRLDLTFTPRLSFQLYAQPFISSGDFEQTAELVTPQSYQFSEWIGEAPDRDFNLRSLRGTAVLRWEWHPGSTLYVAWQQVRSDFAPGVGDFDFGRDRAALFRAQPDNVLVLKMNYWLAP